MKRGWLGVAVLVSTLLASLLYVKGRLLVVELSYSLSQKEAERSKLERERQALMVERATLRSPDRIEKIARSKLGLHHSLSGVSMVIVPEETHP